MSPEAWIAVGGCVVTLATTLATIVYQAGRLHSKLDGFTDAFKRHEVEDRENDLQIFDRLRDIEKNVEGLRVGSSMHLENPRKSGGHRQFSAGE